MNRTTNLSGVTACCRLIEHRKSQSISSFPALPFCKPLKCFWAEWGVEKTKEAYDPKKERKDQGSISGMALSSSPLSPTLLTTTQSSSSPSTPKLLPSHSPLTSFSFPTKPTTTHTIHFHRLSSTSASDKWRAKVSFFPAFSSKGKDAKTLKEELLDAIASLDRGADATPEDQQTVDQVGLPFLHSLVYFLALICFLGSCFSLS